MATRTKTAPKSAGAASEPQKSPTALKRALNIANAELEKAAKRDERNKADKKALLQRAKETGQVILTEVECSLLFATGMFAEGYFGHDRMAFWGFDARSVVGGLTWVGGMAAQVMDKSWAPYAVAGGRGLLFAGIATDLANLGRKAAGELPTSDDGAIAGAGEEAAWAEEGFVGPSSGLMELSF